MQRKYDYRRNLPHFQPDQTAFFITFATCRRWILPESVRTIVMEACLHSDGCRFVLYGLVVMPDHVHLVLTPLYDAQGQFSLSEILQGIKSTSAHRINKALGRKGRVWQEESFDRALRRDESIEYRVEYIIGNPWRSGLVSGPLDYRWLWRRTCWND